MTKHYWISPSGKLVNAELGHEADVQKNPAKYGLGSDDVKDRTDVFRTMFAKGWIRLMLYGPQAAFELSSINPKTIRLMQNGLLATGAHPMFVTAEIPYTLTSYSTKLIDFMSAGQPGDLK